MEKPDRKLITTGSPFEEEFAYSRALVQGDWCFVAGTTGYDYATMTLPESAEAQARNCFKTIRGALEEAGFAMSDIVRIRAYATDPAHWQAAGPAVREALSDVRPPNTAIITDLIAPEMKIEIEATAYRGG
ncbi:MAG: RidA family protein [Pseudomonadota bacterium]